MYAVLFDIDGTLVQTGGAGQLAFAEAFAAEFGVRELSGAVPFAGRSDQAIALQLMQVHGVAASEENWRRFREAYLSRLPAALAARSGRVLPGVHALLDTLRTLEHALVGLLTGNLRAGAVHKLTYYGLMDRFAFGGFGDASDDRCDIAAAALAEARQAAVQHSRSANGAPLAGAVVIGDTSHDVLCARAIGACAVAVATGNSPREELVAAAPDLLLDDLSDAEPLIEIIHNHAP